MLRLVSGANVNNWTGDTTLFNGTVRVEGAGGEVIPNGAGKGNVIINGDSTFAGTNSILDLFAKTETINGLSSAGDLTKVFVTNSAVGTGTLILGDNNAAGSFGGVIQNGTTPATMITAITKIGTGTQVFSGANTYTGLTTVNAGTLQVNGSHAGSYKVGTGGTLGGTGTITPSAGNQITVDTDGVIAPGASIGVLKLDGLNTSATLLAMGNGGDFLFELNSILASDQIALINGAAGDIAFNNSTINFSVLGPLSPGLHTLFTADVAGAYSGITTDGGGNILTGLTIGTGLGAYPGSALQVSGNNIVLNVVPEPGTALLFGLAGLALCTVRRKR